MTVTLRWLHFNVINAVEPDAPDPSAFSSAERRGRADVTCRKSPVSSFMAPRDYRISQSHTLLKQDGANKYGAWAL